MNLTEPTIKYVLIVYLFYVADIINYFLQTLSKFNIERNYDELYFGTEQVDYYKWIFLIFVILFWDEWDR